MESWLINISNNHALWVYALIAILACAEGPFLSMIFGVLLRLGYFSFWPIYIALMGGDLIGDTVWYYIGARYGHNFIQKYGKYFSITEEAVQKVELIFNKYRNSVLFISKISNGFGFAIVTLMTAGMIKIPFLQYISINVIGQFIWTGTLLAVGYFLGEYYTTVNSVFGYLSAGALTLVVIGLFLGYKNYLKKRADNMKIK